MIKIDNIHLPLDFDFSDVFGVVSRELNIDKSKIISAKLYRKSVDARKKSDVHFCISVTANLSIDEQKAVKHSKKASLFCEEEYTFKKCKNANSRPVVIGFGPAGMFAALTLARAGMRPIVFERGEDADRRKETVDAFQCGKPLNTESNVQFGEGGAGTFSDGKLNTGIKDIRCRAVLKEFVRFGAEEKILIEAKPHVGTDKLIEIVKNLRNEIISLGGEVHFDSRFEGIEMQDGKISAVKICREDKTVTVLCRDAVLAIGHSARDTFEYLKKCGVALSRKPFSVGLRIEHLTRDINKALYGDFADSPFLGAADYKLAVHLDNGSGVYTFCMCPGGSVINASSEVAAVAVNGMSYSKRDGENSNSALLTDVLPQHLEGDDVLEGMYLQREIERRAFEIGSGKVPIQTVGSFLRNEENKIGKVKPTVKPGTVFSSVYDVLPKNIADNIKCGISEFGKKISGFDGSDALLSFPETRSSSPVRIIRNESGNSVSLDGLYPCGEGAGYAGGIMSAAVDGIKIAENIILKY